MVELETGIMVLTKAGKFGLFGAQWYSPAIWEQMFGIHTSLDDYGGP